MGDKEAGAQLRPRDELLTLIDGLVAAFMREDDVRTYEAISALSEAAERIRDDKTALEGIAIHGRGVQGIGGARAVALKASACLATGTTTMASDPKEALERLKVDAGNPAVHTKPGELRNVDKALVDLADLRTLIAEREGLERRVTEVEAANESMSTALGFAQNARCAAEAEVERLRAENEALEKGGAEFWLERIRRGNERTYAAESRLSALEEALRAAADDWNNDTDMQDYVWAKVDTTELLALLHPTVPVEVADSGLAAADNNHMTDLLAVDEECGRVAEMLSIRHFSACWNSSGAYDLVTGAGFTHAADFLASVLRKAQEATKAAYKQGWNDREDDLILGAKRLGAPVQPHPDVTGLVEALTLILPMAKGYAGEHPVGNNREFANHAEATLAAFQSRQEEDIDK